jgi:hypothetical protein
MTAGRASKARPAYNYGGIIYNRTVHFVGEDAPEKSWFRGDDWGFYELECDMRSGFKLLAKIRLNVHILSNFVGNEDIPGRNLDAPECVQVSTLVKSFLETAPELSGPPRKWPKPTSYVGVYVRDPLATTPARELEVVMPGAPPGEGHPREGLLAYKEIVEFREYEKDGTFFARWYRDKDRALEFELLRILAEDPIERVLIAALDDSLSGLGRKRCREILG